MKSLKKLYLCIVAIALPLTLGLLSSFIAKGAMEQFKNMNQPPLAPPAWLFPVAWTILYICMGLASFFLFITQPKTSSEKTKRNVALILYVAQLILNFIWSPIFFNAQLYYLAIMILALMWIGIANIVLLAKKINKVAFWLLLPYLLWATFAAYLNVGVALLN